MRPVQQSEATVSASPSPRDRRRRIALARARSAWVRIDAVGVVPWACAFALAAFLVRLPLMFDGAPAVTPDGMGYLMLGDNLVDGRGYGPFGLIRPPGYPLLIVIARGLPLDPNQAIVVVQHLMGAALVAGILLVTWRFFGRAPALIAAAMATASPQLLDVEHQILADFLFTVLVFAGTALLAAAVMRDRPSLLHLAAAGLLFGIATDVKPLAQIMVVATPITLALIFRAWRPVLVGSLVATLAMAAMIVPWVVRNAVKYDHAAISIIGDPALFWRVFDGDRLAFVGDDPDTVLVRRLYREAAAGEREPVGVWHINTLLMERGYTRFEAGRIQRDMALRAIKAEPFAFASNTVFNFKEFARHAGPTHTVVTPELAHQFALAAEDAPSLVRRPVGSVSWRMMDAVAPALTNAWWLLSFGGLAALLVLLSPSRTARRALVAFGLTWLLIAGGTALTGVPTLRYSVAGMPIMWVIGSAGIVFVVTALFNQAVRMRKGESSRA